MKGEELQVMGLLLRSLCCGYSFIGTGMGHIAGNQLYCKVQDVNSKACMGQACNMAEISRGRGCSVRSDGAVGNEYICPAQFLTQQNRTCLAEFSKSTNVHPLGNRVFITRKWFPWDLGVFMAKFCFYKWSFIWTLSCSFVYVLSMTAFVLRQQRWIVVKEIEWSICNSDHMGHNG